jgi:hypothetical protein
MRTLTIATAALLGITAASALAQAPSGMNPVTGARPGHDVGIGESLPRSNKASNIVPTDTHSNIAPTLPPSAIGGDAASLDYLRAARASLVAGRTGQASSRWRWLRRAHSTARLRKARPTHRVKVCWCPKSATRVTHSAPATTGAPSSSSIAHWRAEARTPSRAKNADR